MNTPRPGSPPHDKPRPRVRLQRFLAAAGLGSRRHCEEYIEQGRVSIDGHDVKDLGTTVDPETQKVRVDGELIRPSPKKYYLVNKPAGYVCTHRDPAGRPRAVDLVPQQGSTRLFTVGRLDENSQGLLLVTNDGELANRLAHPRYRVERRYRVQVAGDPSGETLDELKRGLHFAEGKFRVQSVRKVRTQGRSTVLELVLLEGQNREIRRLLARVGHKVLHLQRIGFGPLKLGKLAAGEFRPLQTDELRELRQFTAHTGGPRKTGPRKAAKPGSPPRGPRKPASTARGPKSPARGGRGRRPSSR
jgi:23S rRNA pseudouridine2605 synthase